MPNAVASGLSSTPARKVARWGRWSSISCTMRAAPTRWRIVPKPISNTPSALLESTDLRVQELSADALHWLGVKRVGVVGVDEQPEERCDPGRGDRNRSAGRSAGGPYSARRCGGDQCEDRVGVSLGSEDDRDHLTSKRRKEILPAPLLTSLPVTQAKRPVSVPLGIRPSGVNWSTASRDRLR